MPSLEEGRYPAVPEVALEASPHSPSLLRSGVDVSVANKSLFPLICRFAAKTATKSFPLDPEFVWVDAQTSASLNLNVPFAFPPVRAVNVRAYHVGALVERTVRVRAPYAVYSPLLPLLALILFFASIPVYRATHVPPQVLALSAPPRVSAGDRVDVQYATTGSQSTAYDVKRGTRPIANGTLAPASGTFTFTALAPGAYDITLHASNAYGAKDAVQHVVAQATASPLAPAAISSLAVDPPVATAGSSLVVSYNSRAQKGTVRLLDASGVAWDAQPWSRRGMSALTAPHVSRPERFTVELSVSAGVANANARTGLLVVPPSPAPRVAAFAPIARAPQAPHIAATPSRVTTQPDYVVSGEYFRVTVNDPDTLSGLVRVTLQAADGSPIASHTPADGLMFVAPVVSHVQRYYLVLTLSRNRSGGLMVQPFDVHPH